ncbi:MAG: GNAT family N-acetyltransferase [Solirubrobacterales bacterium]
MSVELRESVSGDVEGVLALEADPAVAPFVEAWPAERHLVAIGDPGFAHLQVVVDDRPAGFVILAGLHDPNDCIELRRIVVSPPGRGLGRAALELVVEHAFGPLGAHRLWLDVKPGNERARRLYASLGFAEEGVMRDALRTEDGYEPLVLMAKLRRQERPRRGAGRTVGERGFEPL